MHPTDQANLTREYKQLAQRTPYSPTGSTGLREYGAWALQQKLETWKEATAYDRGYEAGMTERQTMDRYGWRHTNIGDFNRAS